MDRPDDFRFVYVASMVLKDLQTCVGYEMTRMELASSWTSCPREGQREKRVALAVLQLNGYSHELSVPRAHPSVATKVSRQYKQVDGASYMVRTPLCRLTGRHDSKDELSAAASRRRQRSGL